jgi:ubiquinone/menaquinone biosynthesis C-methylase UbiE
MQLKPAERFTTRVESYRHFRPRYPSEIVETLHRECTLKTNDLVADVAAGTGLLAEIFLAAAHPVIAIEPNDAMRAVCAALQSDYPRLQCVRGTAENTGLPNRSVALVTVAQALHWFDLPAARAEFARILAPGGWCAVIYNHRRMGGDAFHDGYERILQTFGTDYAAVQARHAGPQKIAEFFAPSAVRTLTVANHQDLQLAGLMGRVLSSSYMPQPGHPQYEAMTRAVETLFTQNQQHGTVRILYETVVSYGQL